MDDTKAREFSCPYAKHPTTSNPAQSEPALKTIYIDADGCPVKDETYRVAERYNFTVTLVANHWLRTPNVPWISTIIVESGLDRADDYIAERAGTGDITITADIPLADRCVKAGALAISPHGKLFTTQTIGDALATRNLMTSLREAHQVTGEFSGGQKPFNKQNRAQFLQTLDQAASKIHRSY